MTRCGKDLKSEHDYLFTRWCKTRDACKGDGLLCHVAMYNYQKGVWEVEQEGFLKSRIIWPIGLIEINGDSSGITVHTSHQMPGEREGKENQQSQVVHHLTTGYMLRYESLVVQPSQRALSRA